MLTIGITGGVGAGKSRILDYLQQHTRCRILPADEAGNRVKEPGQKCYAGIVELFGREILEEDGNIHRGKMAEKIFADKELLKQVNAIIHPAVKEFILYEIEKERLGGKTEVFFLEAALLIEAGYEPYLDELWYVFSEEGVRRQRLRESRGYSEEKITQIMASQLTEEEFRRHAAAAIDNSGEFEETAKQLEIECKRLGVWKHE